MLHDQGTEKFGLTRLEPLGVITRATRFVPKTAFYQAFKQYPRASLTPVARLRIGTYIARPPATDSTIAILGLVRCGRATRGGSQPILAAAARASAGLALSDSGTSADHAPRLAKSAGSEGSWRQEGRRMGAVVRTFFTLVLGILVGGAIPSWATSRRTPDTPPARRPQSRVPSTLPSRRPPPCRPPAYPPPRLQPAVLLP